MNFVKNFNPGSIKRKLIMIKIEPDISHLSDNQKRVIHYLIECSKIINEVFHLQKHPDNLKIKKELKNLNQEAVDQYFKIMNGPVDEFCNKPYIRGIKKYPQAGFYPRNLSREEWNEFISLNLEQKDDFISPYTVIVRKNKQLAAVPYFEYYRDYLKKGAEILMDSIDYVDNYYLKSYLTSQANAFVNNDFDEANIRWIQLADNDIEPLIGPHEFYEDRFLGYKASFTAHVGVKNRDEFKKLAAILRSMDILQSKLPIPAHYKKNKRGSTSQILVVDLIYCAGDGRGYAPTAAFNLPNSQKIRAQFGSKKVLFHNIIKAKFYTIMSNIAREVLSDKNFEKVTFAAYFNLILLHEVSHELGIGLIKDSDGNFYNVSYYLKDLYSIIEEAKADIMGTFSLIYLVKQCIVVDCPLIDVYNTYLVGLFRSIRFGKDNAHGIAGIIQWNYLIREAVFIINPGTKKISIDLHKFEKSIDKLLTIILTLQGEVNYQKANEFIQQYSQIDETLAYYLKKMSNYPIDILAWFPLAGEKEFVF